MRPPSPGASPVLVNTVFLNSASDEISSASVTGTAHCRALPQLVRTSTKFFASRFASPYDFNPLNPEATYDEKIFVAASKTYQSRGSR